MMEKRAREEQHGVAVLGLGREETLWVFGSFCYVFFFSLSRYSSVPLVQWRERTTEEGEGWCGRGLRSVDDVVAASTTASTSHDCTAEKKRHLHTLATQEHTNERMPPDERRKKKREEENTTLLQVCFPVTWPWNLRFHWTRVTVEGKVFGEGRGDVASWWRRTTPPLNRRFLGKENHPTSPARIWRGFLQWFRFFSARNQVLGRR